MMSTTIILVPSGSIVMVNVWSILRDPDVFPSPEQFQPGRFLNNERAVEVARSIFGFGRRVCPGIHFAEASIFIAIATALSRCTISDPTNMQGSTVSKDVEPLPGMLSHPKKFRCRIIARKKET
ncbi:cytochrome P450 [Mycena polygramma]|nr:cytochrome P450 [Mycena polygramma]